MVVGMLVGALDHIMDNKFDLGKQFEEGFNAMGPWPWE
jgi:ethanolamine transporter